MLSIGAKIVVRGSVIIMVVVLMGDRVPQHHPSRTFQVSRATGISKPSAVHVVRSYVAGVRGVRWLAELQIPSLRLPQVTLLSLKPTNHTVLAVGHVVQDGPDVISMGGEALQLLFLA